jgi:hypothetical protein
MCTGDTEHVASVVTQHSPTQSSQSLIPCPVLQHIITTRNSRLELFTITPPIADNRALVTLQMSYLSFMHVNITSTMNIYRLHNGNKITAASTCIAQLQDKQHSYRLHHMHTGYRSFNVVYLYKVNSASGIILGLKINSPIWVMWSHRVAYNIYISSIE